jgi:[ribosomal protein S18]-alanine N-acetyltransferase
MGRLTLRPLGVMDLDLAASLHGAAFAPFGERAWTRQDVAELLATAGAMGVVAEQDGAGVGFAFGRAAGDEAELLTIAVHVDHRRHGFGRALLGALIERVHQQGATALFLEVAVDNRAACALYEQAGFQTVGRRPSYYSRGRERPAADASIMRLILRPAV